MCAPFLQEFGWSPTILSVDPQDLAIPKDEWLTRGIPDEIPVHQARAISLRWSKIPGFGNLDYRAYRGVKKLGCRLLKQNPFELIYFSTTVFSLMRLGPYWKKKFPSTPYVVDYQDPWVNDYYRIHPEVPRPGGRLKYAVVDWLSRRHEPLVLENCSGITSVSPDYLQQLHRRYPWLGNRSELVLPFPGAKRDYDRICQEPGKQTMFDPANGLRNWVYVGRGGHDMTVALAGFFSALSHWKARNPSEYQRTRIHFIGTSYAPQGKGEKTILPIAQEFGVSEIVEESTDRVSYETMLRCLLDADALIVPGSNDPAYTASKIYPYLLAKKPLLAVFHENSSVTEVIERAGGAQLVTFADHSQTAELADAIYKSWFQHEAFARTPELNSVGFEAFTDRSSSQKLCSFFDRVLESS